MDISSVILLTFSLLITTNSQLPFIRNGSCVPYNSMFPTGACLKYMGNAKVLFDLDKNNIKLNAQTALWFEVYYPSILRMLKTESRIQVKELALKSLRRFFCDGRFKGIHEVEKLFDKVVDALPTYDEVLQDFPFFKWYSCYNRYPICFHDKTGKVRASLPCKNEFLQIKNTPLFGAVKSYQNLTRHCPTYHSRLQDFIFNSSNLYEADIHHIENCQKYTSSDSKQEKTHTSECYNGVGLLYNGTVSIGRNGKKCVPWNTMPGFHSNVYSDLKDNYCRNPQGYGKSPWCYTDMEKREVSSCSVPLCGKGKSLGNNYTSLYVTLIPMGLICVVVVGGILFVVWFITKRRGERDVNDRDDDDAIQPYRIYGLNSPEQIERLLDGNNEANEAT